MNTPIEAIIAHPCTAEWLHFTSPVAILTTTDLPRVREIIDEVERRTRDEALWCVGWISYEASPAFDPALVVREDASFPKVWFALFSSPSVVTELPSPSQSSLGEWIAETSPDDYEERLRRIRALIKAGETYQVNYTVRLLNTATDSPLALFASMVKHQKGKYSAFLRTGDFTIASASPELLFKRNGDSVICRPMKGTAPRGRYPDEDIINEGLLRDSQKDRAENSMIVDMTRNDLSKVATRGSVHVLRHHHIERYPHMFQMTTDVVAQSNASLFHLLQALFPAASITGAPKPRTMRIIRDLESSPRKIYTGSIGIITPDQNTLFNVAIRTTLIDHRAGSMQYGTGSGVVWDSIPQREYEECITKAAAVLKSPKEFNLFETILWEPESGFFLLNEHLTRLERSARFFQWSFDAACVRSALDQTISQLTRAPGAHRVCVTVSENNAITIAHTPLIALPSPYTISLANTPVHSSDLRLFHKTTDRTPYNEARANTPGYDDLILWNERGELTETLIGNLVMRHGDEMSTPPIKSGLLAGCFRALLIEQEHVTERVLYKEDLENADEILVVNSLRKMWQPRFIKREATVAAG